MPVGEAKTASEKPHGTAEKESPWYLPWISLAQALAWPLVALVIARMLLKLPAVDLLVKRLYDGVTELSVAGLKIEMSKRASASIDDIRKLIAQVPDTHREWIANTHIRPQFLAVLNDVKEYLTTSQCDSGAPLDEEDFGRYRFTLHVLDVLLADSFRQLVDYAGYSRGGAGRIFSIRMGIIGKAWRSVRSEYVNAGFTEEQLIERWGMNREETQSTGDRKKTYMAVLLKSEQGMSLAVFYCDVAETQTKLFDTSRSIVAGMRVPPDEVFRRFAKKVADASNARGLTASLAALEEARVKVEQIDFYEKHHS